MWYTFEKCKKMTALKFRIVITSKGRAERMVLKRSTQINFKSYQCSSPGIANLGPLPLIINKVLLEHSCIHSFTDELWLLLSCNNRTKQAQPRLSELKSLQYLLSSLLPPTFINLCASWAELTGVHFTVMLHKP